MDGGEKKVRCNRNQLSCEDWCATAEGRRFYKKKLGELSCERPLQFPSLDRWELECKSAPCLILAECAAEGNFLTITARDFAAR